MELTDQDIEALERATLDAVAPPRVEEMAGWLLPLEDTSIGRAKSAVPLRHHDMAKATLPAIEAVYTQQGLHAQFRLADVPTLAPLHDALRERGYTPRQPTLVQTARTADLRALAASAVVTLQTQPLQEWSAVYTAHGFDPADGAQRVAALSRGAHAVYASIHCDKIPVAAGVGCFSHGWASVHGMRTVAPARGQGLAPCILAALAQEAQERGLEKFFLQVEEGNQPALALYRRAGFVTAWRYHYWRRSKD